MFVGGTFWNRKLYGSNKSAKYYLQNVHEINLFRLQNVYELLPYGTWWLFMKEILVLLFLSLDLRTSVLVLCIYA